MLFLFYFRLKSNNRRRISKKRPTCIETINSKPLLNVERIQQVFNPDFRLLRHKYADAFSLKNRYISPSIRGYEIEYARCLQSIQYSMHRLSSFTNINPKVITQAHILIRGYNTLKIAWKPEIIICILILRLYKFSISNDIIYVTRRV